MLPRLAQLGKAVPVAAVDMNPAAHENAQRHLGLDPARDAPTATPLPLLERDAWMNPWLAEMFCDWVAGRRADHPTALDDNIQCAALLFAAVESAHTGMPVNVAQYLLAHLDG